MVVRSESGVVMGCPKYYSINDIVSMTGLTRKVVDYVIRSNLVAPDIILGKTKGFSVEKVSAIVAKRKRDLIR